MSLQRILELTKFSESDSKCDLEIRLEEINSLISEMVDSRNLVELSDDESAVISACIEVISDLPIGFEAINGYVDVHFSDDEDKESAIASVQSKF